MRALILALALGGCAASIAGANEAGGVIGNHGWSPARSFEMAEQHCQRYGKHARITGTDHLAATQRFECVS